MNWLGHEGLHFVQTLMMIGEKSAKLVQGLFSTLNAKFKPQHNESILLLQYFKLSRDKNESAEEQMDHLRIKANRCNYKEIERAVYKENKIMTAEIIKI